MYKIRISTKTEVVGLGWLRDEIGLMLQNKTPGYPLKLYFESEADLKEAQEILKPSLHYYNHGYGYFVKISVSRGRGKTLLLDRVP